MLEMKHSLQVPSFSVILLDPHPEHGAACKYGILIACATFSMDDLLHPSQPP
jgi:hypothetical protein